MDTNELVQYYNVNKMMVLKKTPFRFGDIGNDKKTLLNTLVNKRDRILSSAASNAEAVRAQAKRDTVSTYLEIHNWFRENDEEIVVNSRAAYEPYKLVNRCKEIDEKAKELFNGFRNVFRSETTRLGEVQSVMNVSGGNLNTMNDILKQMKILSGYGTNERVVGMNPDTSRVISDFEDMVRSEICDDDLLIKRKKTKNGEAEGRKLLADAVRSLRTHERPRYDRLVTLINASDEGLRARYMTVIDDANTPEMNAVARGAAQECCLDRAFHFLYAIWKSGGGIPVGDAYDKLIGVLNYKCNKFINQTDLKTFLSHQTNKYVKDLPLKELRDDRDAVCEIDGTVIEEYHKLQNPLLITPKRFGNGAAGFSKIMNVGQMMNIRDNEKIGKICEFYKNESDIAKLHLGENNHYFQTRVTFWLTHNIIKKAKTSNDYTGNVVGNAMKVRFQ